jgi:hypothetical protein
VLCRGDSSVIDPAETDGKRIAIVMWGEKADGSPDVVAYAGTADWQGGHLTIRHLPQDVSYQVPDELLPRLKLVAPDLKDTLLGADYFLSVTIGSIPDDADRTLFRKTGFKWPLSDKSE